MKLLFLSSLYAPDIGGGAEIILQRTVEGLRARGHQVVVLATGARAGLHREEVNQVRVYRAGLHNFYWHFSPRRRSRLARLAWHLRDRDNPGMRRPLRRVIELEQPDLVVCHNLTGWSVSAWDEISRCDLPIVQVLHDLYLLCPSSTMFKKGRDCRQPCGLCSRFRQGHAERSMQVDAVVGVSRFMLERLLGQGYFQGAHSQVIYNASPYAPMPEPVGPAGPPAPLRFGYLGTLSEPKGVGWMIEQFKRLPFDASLAIAGRGQEDDERGFRAMAADDPRIRFVGYQQPRDFYAGIDVALVPSMWNEPFGMVAVEACAHSRPVIASRMGGLTEIIQDSLNGLLCSPDDPDSLGLAMLRLHQQPDLLARLAAQARRSVAGLLDLELMLDSYERVFTHTLQTRPAAPRPNPA
ncbi:glycosyltransferase family 4 protein [uncultured Pseudomonas sp.]|uniref:glycosyltransferase family 4 protein n=1 Tax=uncultured Pseudomonas sp. TaxID=114707 RepID=UPI0025F188C7|nr:glycosyltransferase family 4 protein [uncultured Pseudomonas sp.]